jgi:predicted DNA-binding protein YlxM (UPF0122 family)
MRRGGVKMLEDVIRKGRLIDIYGPLLTDRQRQCMELYFLMDWSLAEIADELHITRQGVYDMLTRASKSLESYEQRLHLLDRHDAVQAGLDKAVGLLTQGTAEAIDQARCILNNLEV